MGVLQRVADWFAPPVPGEPSALAGQLVTIGGGDVAQVSSLPAEVAAAFGINTATSTVTRSQAMSIPAVSQGRDAIAGVIGTFPLIDLSRGGQLVDDTRPLLAQPDPDAPAPYTLAWTVDDLMFYGIAWWHVTSRDRTGYPSRAPRVHPNRVRVDASAGRVYLDGKHIDDSELIRFDALTEGLLTRGKLALRTALLLEAAAARYAVADRPQDILEDTRTQGPWLEDTEVTTLLDAWEAGRAARRTAYLPPSLKYSETKGWSAAELQLVEARQQSARDIARLLNLDSDAVNAPSASGMTYQNAVERRRSRLDTALRLYMAPIVSRLSMGDVTPAGHRVNFDTAQWLLGDDASRVALAVEAAGGPVMTADEARGRYLNMPPMEAPQ